MRDAEKDLAMCEAATPGEWGVTADKFFANTSAVSSKGYGIGYGLKEGDAQFISEAREALPYWIDRAVSLEKEVDMLRDALEKIDIHIRSTGDPVPHIIQTLKDTLPEYKDWWNIGE